MNQKIKLILNKMIRNKYLILEFNECTKISRKSSLKQISNMITTTIAYSVCFFSAINVKKVIFFFTKVILQQNKKIARRHATKLYENMRRPSLRRTL